MQIPIEDYFEDILAKSQRGLGLSDRELAARTGVDPRVIQSLKDGDFSEAPLRKLAPALALDADALVASARKEWYPRPADLPGLQVFNTPYHSMHVNAYLVWDAPDRVAVAFDTGADAGGISETVRAENLRLEAIFLTHSHPDHIQDLDNLRRDTGEPPVYLNEHESMPGAESFGEGAEWRFGPLHIRALHTHGHSAGGTTYVIGGLEKPVAVVGDALFAGSMGGGMVSYANALDTNRKKIMTLPDETILCPGHGPTTTVGEEKAHNPFFPEFK